MENECVFLKTGPNIKSVLKKKPPNVLRKRFSMRVVDKRASPWRID